MPCASNISASYRVMPRFFSSLAVSRYACFSTLLQRVFQFSATTRRNVEGQRKHGHATAGCTIRIIDIQQTQALRTCHGDLFSVFPLCRLPTLINGLIIVISTKGMFLYSAASSPLDRSKHLTLLPPGRPVHSNTNLTSLGSIQPRCSYCMRTSH